MSAVASLGMYDHPGQHSANDRLWAAMAAVLQDRGIAEVSVGLDRSRPVQEIWRDPGLLFGQICGYPLITDPTLALQLIALPMYDAHGCEADTHGSVIIARRSDALTAFRGCRGAINSRDSNTGMNLFRAAIAEIADGAPFFSSVRETGSHRESVRAVVDDEADIAAIDTVTFAALDRFEPELTAAVRIIAHTPRSPCLPFVTGAATNPDTVAALQSALAHVIADPDLADARADLFLRGIAPANIGRFAPLLQFERDAVRAGYPEIR